MNMFRVRSDEGGRSDSGKEEEEEEGYFYSSPEDEDEFVSKAGPLSLYCTVRLSYPTFYTILHPILSHTLYYPTLYTILNPILSYILYYPTPPSLSLNQCFGSGFIFYGSGSR